MDRQRWMVICGVAAIVLYSLSWLMQLVESPGYRWVRLTAILPFALGGGILLWDRYKRAKAQGRLKRNKTGWEDILGEEEEQESK
jgi:CHASE2 domain-containing sensor protein